MTDRDFYKRALLLILPVVLQSVINQGVNMMDTVMVGRLGEVSISASSLANQYYQIFQFLCMGISAAGLVLAAQYWGAGERQTVHRVFDLILQIVLVTGTLFAAATALFSEQILSVYTDDAEVIREGAKYLAVTSLVFLPHGLSLVMANLFRAIGNAKLGLSISAISFAVNIGCNYVFIFGKLGMPAMGVMGAAVGTLCARTVECTVCAVYMFRFEKVLRYRPTGIVRLPKKLLLQEFRRLGLPAVISDTILGLASSMFSVILGHMGREVVSSYAIVTVLERMCTVANLGLSSAAGVMIGQTVGKGDFERAHKEGKTFLCMSVAIGLVSAVLVWILGIWSVGLYEITPETAAIAVSMMQASAIVVFFQSVQSITSKGILRGGGDTKFLMVADVIFQWCASIPLGYLTGIVFELSPFWVLIAIRIDYIIKAVWLSVRLKGSRWIHQAKTV